MKKVEIALLGCDDCTRFDMMVTQEQYDFLMFVARMSAETSSYGCMPTMEVNLHSQSQDSTSVTEPVTDKPSQ